MLDLRYTPSARKDLERVGRNAATKILAKIEKYAANPDAFANNVKKLKGSDSFRLRAGDYRILFTAEGVVLTIMKIGHRRDIYH